MASTNATLLGRLRNLNDPDAWREFEQRYTPRIKAWCVSRGLQDADVDNVTQEVLLKVAGKMQSFVYTPGDNFSGLLHVIWRNTWIDFLRDAKRRELEGQVGSDVWNQLRSVAESDLADHLVEECEREELHEAMARVRAQVTSRDWDLYWRRDFQDHTLPELASETGISVAAVGMAVSRVRKKIRQQLAELRGDGSP